MAYDKNQLIALFFAFAVVFAAACRAEGDFGASGPGLSGPEPEALLEGRAEGSAPRHEGPASFAAIPPLDSSAPESASLPEEFPLPEEPSVSPGLSAASGLTEDLEPSLAEPSLPASPSPAPDSLPGTELAVRPERYFAGGPDSGGTPSPEPSKAGAFDSELFEEELLRLINARRLENGRAPLEPDEDLRWAARIRAPEVLESLSHTRPDGTAYYTAFEEAGFVYAGKWHGENVSSMWFPAGAYDPVSAASFMFEELAGSPGHYTNMLSENFAHVGIGAVVLSDGNTLRLGSAQMFASRASGG